MYDDYIIRFRVRNHDDVIPPSDVRTLCRETIRQTNPDKYISYLLNTWKDHSFIPMMPSRRHLFHSGYIFFIRVGTSEQKGCLFAAFGILNSILSWRVWLQAIATKKARMAQGHSALRGSRVWLQAIASQGADAPCQNIRKL